MGQINNKYNLVCAPISCYTGFVPSSKLEDIEKFRLSPSDSAIEKIKVIKFTYPNSQENEIKILKNYYPDLIVEKNKLHVGNSIYLGNTFVFIKEYEEIDNTSICICAPLKDMNLKGMSKIGKLFRKATTISVPDPVVFQPVKGGFLILTAWGEEASDPIVVSEINN